jgi:hypothetical protein
MNGAPDERYSDEMCPNEKHPHGDRYVNNFDFARIWPESGR